MYLYSVCSIMYICILHVCTLMYMYTHCLVHVNVHTFFLCRTSMSSLAVGRGTASSSPPHPSPSPPTPLRYPEADRITSSPVLLIEFWLCRIFSLLCTTGRVNSDWTVGILFCDVTSSSSSSSCPELEVKMIPAELNCVNC